MGHLGRYWLESIHLTNMRDAYCVQLLFQALGIIHLTEQTEVPALLGVHPGQESGSSTGCHSQTRPPLPGWGRQTQGQLKRSGLGVKGTQVEPWPPPLWFLLEGQSLGHLLLEGGATEPRMAPKGPSPMAQTRLLVRCASTGARMGLW